MPSRRERWRAGAHDRLEPVRVAAQPVTTRIRLVLSCVSRFGWGVITTGVIAWVIGFVMGWVEARYVAAACLVLVVLAALMTIGRTTLRVTLELAPERVVVGEAAAARVQVVNIGTAPLLPLGLDLPVGQQVARFTLPTLVHDADFEDMVVIPTARRGVIGVGPVATLRGDPLGLVRRELVWSERVDLFVHPKIVPLDPVGSGLLRDLEGHTTNDISMSDLAFHTLREYAPGDDRRYIHWRSSAKTSTTLGRDRFLVRQFLDTRRSHIALVVDCLASSYLLDEEFELAIAAAASIAVRSLRDEMDLTIVAGQHAAVQPRPHVALDTFARAEPDEEALHVGASRVARLSPDISVAVMVTGPLVEFTELRRAASQFPPEVQALAIRVEEGAPITMQTATGLTVLTIGKLTDLPLALAGGQIQ